MALSCLVNAEPSKIAYLTRVRVGEGVIEKKG